MLIPINAEGYSYKNAEFKEVLILPETPDGSAEIKARALRVTSDFGLEIYNGTAWIPISGAGVSGGYQLYKQITVGSGEAEINDGDTSYQSNDLIGLLVDVFHNGSVLNTGLSDRLSYTYDIMEGDISFGVTPMSAGDVIRIYKYQASEANGGIAIVATYADMILTGSPHFILVQADENLQEPDQPAPISLYFWNGVEILNIISKVSE